MRQNKSIKPFVLGLLSIGLIGCIQKEELAHVGDAENILVTSDQRLLVSGGDNIYQVFPGTARDPEPLFKGNAKVGADKCNFTGIAEYGDWVFTSCVQRTFLIFTNNHLLAANKNDEQLEFKVISALSGSDPYDRIGLPNGLAFAPDGALLVGDYDFIYKSGVARVALSLQGDQPQIISVQKNFVSPTAHGVTSVNGVRVVGDTLYLSDVNTVKRFAFDAQAQVPADIVLPDGSERPNGSTMWSGNLAIVDDIMPLCDGVALTSYLSGQLHYVASYVDTQGEEHFPVLYSSPPFGFESPSALAVANIPGVLDGTDLLVTEKGLLGELDSENGNRLVKAPVTLDLNDPQLCSDIQQWAREAIEG